jgi:putative peptidoglycan lipid II flippase
VALTLPLFLPLRRTGRRLRMTLSFPPGVARSARRLALAGAVALGAQDLATGAILRLANDRGAHGAVVLYNLAWSIFVVPWAVLAVPVATAAFPSLSAYWSAGDGPRYNLLAARGSRVVLLAAAGAAAVMVAVAVPASRVLVLGAPGDVDPIVLARALVAFAPGLVGYGLVAHLSRAHYARGDARTAAVATAVGWALVVAIDVGLVIALPRTWTVTALGVGTTVGMTVTGGWLAVVLRRSAGPEALHGAGRTLAAGLIAGVVGGGLGALLAAVLSDAGAAASVAVTGFVGLISAGGFLAVAALLDAGTVRLLLRRRAADV